MSYSIDDVDKKTHIIVKRHVRSKTSSACFPLCFPICFGNTYAIHYSIENVGLNKRYFTREVD